MTIYNKDVFQRDPTTYTLPNDGVAKVSEPETDEAWAVARYEVEHFVCEGSYHKGLERILRTYLQNLTQPTQQAVWVHGFYGSGKSHLLRILDFLWRDVRFPDGASARGIAKLPDDIREHLVELSNAGKQRGGLWSVAGTLGAKSANDPRLAILQIVLKAAKLPDRLNLAQFDLWIRQEGWYDLIRAGLESRGRNYESEIQHIYVSTPLAEELIKVNPKFASTPTDALQQIRIQFPELTDITIDLMVDMMRQLFEMQSDKDGKMPCVLLALDELQQYLADNYEKIEIVREAVEAAVTQFGSNLLFVAAGQQAMEATTNLQRLQGRFSIPVQLEDRDIQKVLQQTVLLKKPTAQPEIRDILDKSQGEIARHLGGTRIAAQSADDATLEADYPLLPTRRRFWAEVLRAVDRGGAARQLRTQLRLAHEASRAVANEPLGCVVGGDFIFDQQKTILLQTNVLLRDTHTQITDQEKDGSPDGKLKARICALLFLIEQLEFNQGVRGTVDTLADLLVTDLEKGSVELRQKIPNLIDQLLEDGIVTKVEGEYRVQTPEMADWDRDYRNRTAAIKSDEMRVASERTSRLRAAVDVMLKSIVMTQGISKTKRQIDLYFSSDAPPVGDKIPIWVRSGWDIAEAGVKKDAIKAGTSSPIIFVYLPKESAEDLKAQIAGMLTAREVLETRPTPTTDEGKAARSSIESRQDAHNGKTGDIISQILLSAKIFQGGGIEVSALDFRSAVEQATQASMSRLYDRFGIADFDIWPKVADKTRKGDPDALELVDYSGPPEQHPVCKEILACIGVSGMKGNDIRSHFESPNYGWPRDAIDASLTVLTASGHLRATYKGKDAAAADLTGTSIQQAEFRTVENPLIPEERIKLRRLLQDTGMPVKAGDEATGVQQLMTRMQELAESAGGAAPLPHRPSTEYIDDLKEKSGNDLLRGVLYKENEFRNNFNDWTKAAKKAQTRMHEWERLQKLLEHAKSLPIYEEVYPQSEAIYNNRKLLIEPNPIPSLASKVSNDLRNAIKEARNRHLEAYSIAFDDLEVNETWQKLPKEKQQEIRQQRGLVELQPLSIEGEQELLQELGRRPLDAWEDVTFAIGERVEQVLLDAAKELEPKTVRVQLKRATVKTEPELDEYLAEVKGQVMDVLKNGNPVVLP